MVSILNWLAGKSEYYEAKITKTGWGILIGALWTFLGLLWFAVRALPDIYRFFLGLNADQWIIVIFLVPGFILLSVSFSVCFMSYGELVKFHRIGPTCSGCGVLVRRTETNCMNCGHDLRSDRGKVADE